MLPSLQIASRLRWLSPSAPHEYAGLTSPGDLAIVGVSQRGHRQRRPIDPVSLWLRRAV